MSPSGSGTNRGNVDLTSAITSSSDEVNQVISDPERVQKLVSHLPEIDAKSSKSPTSAKQEIKDTITSPQFQQAMSLFSNALQSGQLAPVIQQFDVTSDAVAAATTGDIEQFVKALDKKETSKDVEAMEEDGPTNPTSEKKE